MGHRHSGKGGCNGDVKALRSEIQKSRSDLQRSLPVRQRDRKNVEVLCKLNLSQCFACPVVVTQLGHLP